MVRSLVHSSDPGPRQTPYEFHLEGCWDQEHLCSQGVDLTAPSTEMGMLRPASFKQPARHSLTTVNGRHVLEANPNETTRRRYGPNSTIVVSGERVFFNVLLANKEL